MAVAIALFASGKFDPVKGDTGGDRTSKQEAHKFGASDQLSKQELPSPPAAPNGTNWTVLGLVLGCVGIVAIVAVVALMKPDSVKVDTGGEKGPKLEIRKHNGDPPSADKTGNCSEVVGHRYPAK
ncbi:MAG: hypothetical protein J0I06_19405 [Planctomycetes bacterium]|nr:hypothetical protein [Planctomycetota bacterium]